MTPLFIKFSIILNSLTILILSLLVAQTTVTISGTWSKNIFIVWLCI